MPLTIIRQDITKMRVDAIVNPTATDMLPSGGADASIHKAAGKELLASVKALAPLKVGTAVMTDAFGLPCRYIIHTAGPLWQGGGETEYELLRSCYRASLGLAERLCCETVAIPLISSGVNGFPKDKVLRIASEVIGEHLKDSEMTVFLVVYDKSAYSLSLDVYDGVMSYIDDRYVEENGLFDDWCFSSIDGEVGSAPMRERSSHSESYCRSDSSDIFRTVRRRRAPIEAVAECSELPDSFDDIFKNMDKGFADTLFQYIDKRGLTDVEAYKRSNVSKKTFSKIKCNKDYRPGKITAVSFAIGLHLSLEETVHLLSTAGMCLSRSSKFDLIIEYFVSTGRYETIFDVNEVLYQFDQVLLGCLE